MIVDIKKVRSRQEARTREGFRRDSHERVGIECTSAAKEDKTGSFSIETEVSQWIRQLEP